MLVCLSLGVTDIHFDGCGLSMLEAGGSSTIARRVPRKTLAIGGDTRPDQSGVPAVMTLHYLLGPVVARTNSGLCIHLPSASKCLSFAPLSNFNFKIVFVQEADMNTEQFPARARSGCEHINHFST